MAISPKILKAHGCHPKAWKPLFSAPDNKKLPKIKALEDLLANRIGDGRQQIFRDYRTYQAIDYAYDVPFTQTTPTMIQALLRKNLKPDELLAEVKAWGLNEDELFLTAKRPDGTTCKVVNPPTFFNVLVPLVKAYVTIRRAKLFNERNTSPLLPFEPAHPTAENRVLCEIETDIVHGIATDYGYASKLDDGIFNALMYSFALMFPKEVWHTEYQMEQGEKKEIKVLQKEGIRYVIPHPMQAAWDLKFPISDFNTDTGPEWALFHQVVSYGSIADNSKFWNTKKIGYGEKNFNEYGKEYFQEIMPCAMNFPVLPIGGSDTNREDNAAIYNSNQRDKAVLQTEIPMKIVPSDYGLGDYDYPVWIRFVVASDRTVLYVEPYCYNPVLYCGADSDSNRSKNSSLALEVLPSQDILGNVISQILLTCKQNLAQVNFYDKNVINKLQIDEIRNRPGLLYQGMNFVEYDSVKNMRAGTDVKSGIHSVGFTYKDPSAMFNSINVILMLLERTIQISAQEAGGQASHQQSAAEVKLVGGSTENRVGYTGSYIDRFQDAWKRQLRDATQAYMDSEVESYVPADIEDLNAALEKLGFTPDGPPQEGKVMVRGKKQNIRYTTLVATGRGSKRANDAQVATIMLQTAQALAGNQVISEYLGPKAIVAMFETAAILAGADKDLKIRPDMRQQMNQLQALAKQIMQATVQQVEKDVSAPVAKEVAQIQADIQQLQSVVQKIIQTSQGTPPPAGPLPPPIVGQPPPLSPNGPQIVQGSPPVG